MGEDEFWSLTMGLLFCLLERWRERNAREDRRAGEVVAMLYNINRDTKKDKKGKDWTTWFPQEAPKPVEPQTDEAMLESMKMWAALINNSRKARA